MPESPQRKRRHDRPKNKPPLDPVPQTSATSFITLRISPPKYRKLQESLERTGTVSFITLRYRPAQDPQKFVSVQRDQDQDSAVDVATPAGQPDTRDQKASHQFVGGLPNFDSQQSSALAATKQDITHYAGVDGDTEGIVQHDASLFPREVTQVESRGLASSARALDEDLAAVDIKVTSAAIKGTSAAIKGDQVPQEDAAEGSSQQISVRLQPASLGAPAFVTAATAFHDRDQNHGDSVISNTTPREYLTRSHSTAFSPPAPPARKSKVARLKLPPGWRLDEIMQPVHDPNDVSSILKGVVDDLYDVQSKTHGFIPETQNLLIDKISDISDKLARLKDVTDAQVTPNNPIHNVRIAPEIVDYVDEGRNPDIFTREFVENVQRGNAVINGKKQAFRDFSVILAQKMKEGIGGVDRQVDQIMQKAGLEKELAEAEKKAKEDRKASGTDPKSGVK